MTALRSVPRPSIHELSSFLLSTRLRSLSHRCLSYSLPPPSKSAPHLKSCLPSHYYHHPHIRSFSIPNLRSSSSSSRPPKTHDRGPTSTETTQTDFGTLDVLGGTPAPSTSIDACLWDGFHLNSGVKITGEGDGGAGVLLVAGEAFKWCPWKDGVGLRMVNGRGQWEVSDEVWGVLELVWPKPDLLILGVGKEMRPLSEKTRRKINSLGIRVDIQDTRNAAAQFNLLATERGVGSVAAALIPIGWKEGVGVV